ncbi:MAG TPA: hypothetical protein VIJ75_08095 [Hanamia sp.]
MALTKPPRNTDYDNINEYSSNDEKLDVVFMKMTKESYFNYIDYHKLFITYAQQPLFNARIEMTGLVESQQPEGSQIMYRLKSKAILILDKYDNSYLKYLDANKEY